MCISIDHFWRSEKMRRADDSARALYFYLLTSPHRNRLGAYYLPKAYGAFDLGWDEEKFMVAMNVLERQGIVQYDTQNHVVWVEALSEVPANPNQVKSFLTVLDEVPDTPLFQLLLERLKVSGKKNLKPLLERLEERLQSVEKLLNEHEQSPLKEKGKAYQRNKKPWLDRLDKLSEKTRNESLKEHMPEPLDQPSDESLLEPLTKPIDKPLGQPLTEPLDESLAKQLDEPLLEPFPEPLSEPLNQRLDEPLSKRLNEPLQKPFAEPLAEPLRERFSEPLVKPFAERLSKPLREPFAEPLPKPLNGYGEESFRSAVTDPQSPASGVFPVREKLAGPFPEPFAQPFGEPPSEASSSPSSPPTPPSSTPLTLLSFPQSQDKGVREKEKNKIQANSEKQQNTDKHAISQKEKQNIYENKKNIPQPPHAEGDVWKQIVLSSSKESNGSMYNGAKSVKSECSNYFMEKEKNTANPSREDYNTNRPTIATVVDLYHHLCPSLPRMKGLTAKRKQNIERLLSRYGIDAIRTVFEKAATSDFLSGRNGKWRGCSLDWLIHEENFIKVWEGKYDNRLPRSLQSALDAMMGKPLTPDDFPPEQARLMREFNIDPEELFQNFGRRIVGVV